MFIKHRTIVFADDMTVYLIGPSAEQPITSASQELDQLHHWCLSNTLTTNTDKTHFVLFTSKRQFNLPQLTSNGNPVCRTLAITFLGVTYDGSMSLKHHFNNVTLELSRHIALLHQVKDFVPQNMLI